MCLSACFPHDPADTDETCLLLVLSNLSWVKEGDILELALSQYQQDAEASWVLGTKPYFHSGT